MDRRETPVEAPRRWLAMFAVAGLAVLLASLAPHSARADWHELSGEHFVIYGDQDPRTLQVYAERLELFHAAMALVLQRNTETPSPSNRVTVFLVPAPEVRRLYGDKSSNVAGFYKGTAGQSVAVAQRLTGPDRGSDPPAMVLLHEYAHHFMWASTPVSLPRWFVEGFAEFFAGASFKEDKVGLGMREESRADELLHARRVPIRTLLSYDGGFSAAGAARSAVYAQSWALYHYLKFAPEHAGALVKYQQMLATGTDPLAAAEAAFGDLDELEEKVEDYARQRTLNYMTIRRDVLKTAPIEVRRLSEGEAAIMFVTMRSRAGIAPQDASAMAAEARQVAAAHPGDAAVLTALAEAEYDAGNDAAAIAAADRALAIDPSRINAHLQKGFALTRTAQVAGATPEAWKGARAQWIKANKVEHDHPIPLVQYYQTFLLQGIAPTGNAIAGLEWAMQLAPFDTGLRWTVVQQMVRDARYAEAIAILRPLAFSPHPGERTGQALTLLQEIQAKVAGGPAAAESRGSSPP